MPTVIKSPGSGLSGGRDRTFELERTQKRIDNETGKPDAGHGLLDAAQDEIGLSLREALSPSNSLAVIFEK